MQVLTLTQLPIYLPADTAQQPFGDPLSDITVTSASPGVITSPGYNPANGDAVAFSFASGGSMPTGLTAGTRYYVVSASGNTFSVSATKGGAAINTSSTGSLLTLHLLSSQVYGTRCPFKTGDSVVALNLSASPISVQAAPDAGGVAGNPTGPGTYVTIATIAAGSASTIVLSNDWISLTAAGSLILMQN